MRKRQDRTFAFGTKLFVVMFVVALVEVAYGQENSRTQPSARSASLPMSAVSATPSDRAYFTVDAHAESGPMAIWWWRGRLVAIDSAMQYQRSVTFGYSILGRAMWHPDHLLEVGVLTGYQLLVTETYALRRPSRISGRLTSTPLMLDVAMKGSSSPERDFEVGLAIGGAILATTLNDGSRTSATRFELGTMLHAQHDWRVSRDFTLGAGLMVGYMGYRGLLLFTPQLEVTYALLAY